MFVVQVRAKMS